MRIQQQQNKNIYFLSDINSEEQFSDILEERLIILAYLICVPA